LQHHQFVAPGGIGDRDCGEENLRHLSKPITQQRTGFPDLFNFVSGHCSPAIPKALLQRRESVYQTESEFREPLLETFEMDTFHVLN
jgi:hypothetical protein